MLGVTEQKDVVRRDVKVSMLLFVAVLNRTQDLLDERHANILVTGCFLETVLHELREDHVSPLQRQQRVLVPWCLEKPFCKYNMLVWADVFQRLVLQLVCVAVFPHDVS